MTEQEMYIQRLEAAYRICVQSAEKAQKRLHKSINTEQAAYLKGRIDEARANGTAPAIVFSTQTPDYASKESSCNAQEICDLHTHKRT